MTNANEDIEYSPSNINDCVFSAFIFLFIFRRSYKSSTPSLNFIKGKLKSMGSWLLKLSVTFSLAFCLLMAFLSTKFDIQRGIVQITRSLDESYIVNYKQYSFDLVYIMLISLKLSELLLTSSIFILISLWIPYANSAYNNSSETYSPTKLHSSIASFSKIYAIFRIPILIYLDQFSSLVSVKTSTFVIDLLFAIEFLAASFFLIIMNSKFSDLESSRSLETSSLLSLILFFYGIVKYAVNLVDFPFALTDTHKHIICSVQFVLNLTIYILAICMICPLKKPFYTEEDQKRKVKNLEKMSGETNISLVESIIEFDESRA
jgi:hypothetical protein